MSDIAATVLTGLINRKQLCAEFGVSQRTIVRFEAAGLPVHRRGRLRFYDIQATRAWLRGERRGKRRAAANAAH